MRVVKIDPMLLTYSSLIIGSYDPMSPVSGADEYLYSLEIASVKELLRAKLRGYF